jgi:hypothetical protein
MTKLSDKASFDGALKDGLMKWADFLNERTIRFETGRSSSTHKHQRIA